MNLIYISQMRLIVLLWLYVFSIAVSNPSNQENTSNDTIFHSEQGTDDKINIDNMHYSNDLKEIKDYSAVMKIYPKIQIQNTKTKQKQKQAEQSQDFPKDFFNNEKKEIKWKIKNPLQLTIDESDSSALSESETVQKIKQLPKQPTNSPENGSHDSANSKQTHIIETRSPVESMPAQNIETNSGRSPSQPIQSQTLITSLITILIILALVAIVALFWVFYVYCKKKHGKRFEYKQVQFTNSKISIIQIGGIDPKIMNNRGEPILVVSAQLEQNS